VKAALMTGVDARVCVEEVELLPPGPRDVVVEVKAAGVCHSDIAGVRGHIGLEAPTILGHEVAGVVVATGDEVRSVAVGDRIIGSLVPVCGECPWCVGQQTHLCARTGDVRATIRARTSTGAPVTAMLGLGAFAEQMVIDERLAVRVRSDLPDEQLALIGCGIATGVGAVLFTAGVRAGSSVAVIGCGGVGQSVIQGARIAGAAQIVAVDPLASKRQAALQSGATDVLDPRDADTAEAVKALTRTRGVDYAFEVVGHPSTMVAAYDSTRRGGTVVSLGIPAPDARLELSASDFFRAEKRMVGSYYGSTQVQAGFQTFADLIAAGRLDAASLISHRYSLDAVPEALADLEGGRALRGVVQPYVDVDSDPQIRSDGSPIPESQPEEQSNDNEDP
jgi:S-(hydroxymethyl)glutathione dehydrogenase/alcohol dehydrogenase